MRRSQQAHIVHAACLALDSVTLGTADSAIRAAFPVYVIMSDFIAYRDGTLSAIETRKALLEDPLLHSEQDIQKKRLEELASFPFEMSPANLSDFHLRSNLEAFTLLELLRSEPEPPRMSLRMDLDPYGEGFVISQLSDSPPWKRTLFALMCAERVAFTCHDAAPGSHVKGANRVRFALDSLWKALARRERECAAPP